MDTHVQVQISASHFNLGAFCQALGDLQEIDSDFPDLRPVWREGNWVAQGWWHKSHPDLRARVARIFAKRGLQGRVSVVAPPDDLEMWRWEGQKLVSTGAIPDPVWSGITPKGTPQGSSS